MTNLWGSYFSRIEERDGERVAMVRPFRRGLFNRVGLNVGPAMSAASVTPESLHGRIDGLLTVGQ